MLSCGYYLDDISNSLMLTPWGRHLPRCATDRVLLVDSLGREPERGQSSVYPSFEVCALTQNSNIDGTGGALTGQGYFAELLFLKSSGQMLNVALVNICNEHVRQRSGT